MNDIRLHIKDYLVILIIGLAGLCVALLADHLNRWEFLLFLAMILFIALSLLELRRRVSSDFEKISKSIADLKLISVNSRVQLEALTSLNCSLRPDRPLPLTGGWAASPDFLLLITQEMLSRRPTRVLELGSGVSSLVVGYCIKRFDLSCQVFSLDHDQEYAKKTNTSLSIHGLNDFVKVLHAPLVDHVLPDRSEHRWYSTSDIPESVLFDLVIIDGPPTNDDPEARFPLLPILGNQLAEKALMIFDDADREGEQRVISKFAKQCPSSSVSFIPSEKGAAKLTLG